MTRLMRDGSAVCVCTKNPGHGHGHMETWWRQAIRCILANTGHHPRNQLVLHIPLGAGGGAVVTRDKAMSKMAKLFKSNAAPLVVVVYCGPSDERGNWRLGGGSGGVSHGADEAGDGAGTIRPPPVATLPRWEPALLACAPAPPAHAAVLSSCSRPASPPAPAPPPRLAMQAGGDGSASSGVVVSFREVSMLWQHHRRHSQRLVLLLDCANSGCWVAALAQLSKAEQLELALGVQASDCCVAAPQQQHHHHHQLAYQPGVDGWEQGFARHVCVPHQHMYVRVLCVCTRALMCKCVCARVSIMVCVDAGVQCPTLCAHPHPPFLPRARLRLVRPLPQVLHGFGINNTCIHMKW